MHGGHLNLLLLLRLLLLLWLLLLWLLFLGLLLLLGLVLLGLLLLVILLAATLLLQLGKGIGVELCSLLGQLDLAQDGLELRLVDKCDEPAVHVREGCTESWVQDLLVQLEQSSGECDVSKGDVLANEESLVLEDGVEDLEDFLDVLLGLGGGSLVELDDAERGVHPCARRWVDLLVRKADVLLYEGRLVGR